MIAGIAVILGGLWPASRLGSEFMPPLDEGDLMFMPSARPDISTGKARQVLQQTDKLIMAVLEVKSVFGKMGRSDSVTNPAPLSIDEAVIQFKPRSEWRAGMTRADIVKELKQRVHLPGLSNTWTMPIKDRIDMSTTGIKTPVGIRVGGRIWP